MRLLKYYSWDEKYSQEVPEEDEGEVQTDIIPILTPLNRNIDRWPTRVNLTAVYKSLPGSTMVDGLPNNEQLTWIIPVVRDTRKASKLKIGDSVEQGYVSHISALVKNSGIYALSSLAAPLVTLLLAPFLTRSLSHNDYGALAVLTTVIAL